jgi:hypothetical protein
MTPDDYTAVRCGMNISKAIIEGTIDAGIGLENSDCLLERGWVDCSLANIAPFSSSVQQVEVR